jgi:AraC-like DNA-binding protein
MPQVAVRSLLPLLAEVARQGHDPAPVLAASGCEASWLDDTERMIPIACNHAATLEAIAVTGDPCFGLHMAENTRPESFGLHTYLASTSATLRDALGRVIRYMNLIAEHLEYALREEGDTARMSVSSPPESLVVAQQFVVAVNHCFVRALVAAEWRIVEAAFAHEPPAPPVAREYERVFGAPVRFSADHDGIRFDRAFLDAPMRNRDDRLNRALEDLARVQLEARGGSDRTSDRVRVQLLRLPPDTRIELEPLAQRLSMSARTLQRRLADEGVSLRQIVDDVRFERARAYLAMGGLSVAEVGFLLGFAEPAAFSRAFVRWAGKTPQAYRREVSSRA